MDWGVQAMNEHGLDARYVPITPGGTICDWMHAATEDEAWGNLLEYSAFLPYPGKQGFIDRGYKVEKMECE